MPVNYKAKEAAVKKAKKQAEKKAELLKAKRKVMDKAKKAAKKQKEKLKVKPKKTKTDKSKFPNFAETPGYKEHTGYFMYIGDVLLPVTPSKVSYQYNSKNETMILISGGEVNKVKDSGLMDVIIDEILLPMHKYPFAHYDGDKFQKPKYFVDRITDMKRKGKSVYFTVSRLSPDGKKQWDNTRIPVTIEDYKVLEDADKYGLDVGLTLELKQYRKYGSKILTKKKASKKKNGSKKSKGGKKLVSNKKKHRNSTTKSVSKTYKIKNGDSLGLIAKHECNGKCKGSDIYKLNKAVFEKAAKKNGRKSSSNGFWIYPGTVIKLPSE